MKSLLGIATLVLLVSSGLAHGQNWDFDVYLDGRKIGEHTFALHEQPAGRKLESHAEFQVKVLFVEAYRYSHLVREQWQGNCLRSLDARTVEQEGVSAALRDFIAGMTDRYAVALFEQLFIPRPWVGTEGP